MGEAEICDDKVRFYLTHRRHIEEWHAIRSDAVTYGLNVLKELPAALPDMAARRDLVVRYVPLINQDQRVTVAPSDVVVVDGYPVVSFAVGWSRRSMIGEGENPFVGVWVPAVSDHFKNLREAVVNPIRLDREADERDLKSATNWPLYETCAVSDRWWDDPATLLLDIAAQLEALIDTFGHAVWSAARNAAVELGLS